MRAVIQRVSNASVEINTNIHCQILKGLCVLIGFEENDNEDDIEWLSNKICNMRIFNDGNGKMNLSILDNEGEMLLVSQFTLFASTSKGNRPSFMMAAKSEIAIPLYNLTISKLQLILKKPISTGIFGANMTISFTNDGPITILLDSKNKA